MTIQEYPIYQRHAVLGIACVFMLGGENLSAQSDQAGAALEEVVVTGSRLRNEEPVGSSVIALGRDDVNASGAVTIDRLIKEVPQVFDLGISENSRGQSGGNGNITWGNSVNLRGIGPYATLIIVDGHRVVNNSRATDPSIIPTLGVSRVEIVADGASAIYGSDAIAGVVNIIPRRDLDGAEFLGRYGISGDGDFEEYQVGGAFGKRWESGQVMFAYEHIYRSNLSGLDRVFFTNDQTGFGGKDYRVTRCSPGTIIAGPDTYAIPAGGVTPDHASALVAGTANRCDSLIGQDLIPEQQYDSFNTTFTFDLTDNLTLYGDGFYSDREFVRIPGAFSSTLAVPGTNAFYVAPPGFAGSSIKIDYNFVNDLPNDKQTGYARNGQLTTGLRYKFSGGWEMEGQVSYGKGKDNSETVAGLNNGALAAALGSSDPATAFDPFGLHRTSPAVLAALGNQIFLAPTENQYIGYEVGANGTVVEMPGGDLKLAIGFERQDLETDLGLARGNPTTAIAYRHFERKVNSAYAEMLIPIIGSANAVSGASRLDFTAAIRYDDYDDVGDTTNPKFGVSWAPIDTLTFRGTYGTAFRAPLISQIYGNSNDLFGQSYQDPQGGPPIPGFAYSGPNEGLAPEEATTWTIGADWDAMDNLHFGLTYFDVEYKDQVETYLADLAILSREDEFAGTGIILRDEAAAARVIELLNQGVGLARGSFPGGDPNNVTLYVDGRNNNLGRSITKGFDFDVTYLLETATAGMFTFNLNGMYLTDYHVSITPHGTMIDHLNEIFQPLEFKARASVTWDLGQWRSQLKVTHVGSYDNVGITPKESVSSYTPVDLSIAWNLDNPDSGGFFESGLVLGFEVRNVFDEDPPYVNIAPSVNGSGGYDPTTSNPVGRMYSIQLRKIW